MPAVSLFQLVVGRAIYNFNNNTALLSLQNWNMATETTFVCLSI